MDPRADGKNEQRLLRLDGIRDGRCRLQYQHAEKTATVSWDIMPKEGPKAASMAGLELRSLMLAATISARRKDSDGILGHQGKEGPKVASVAGLDLRSSMLEAISARRKDGDGILGHQAEGGNRKLRSRLVWICGR
jgi:hypothetical protein